MRIRLRYQCEFGVVVQQVQDVLPMQAVGALLQLFSELAASGRSLVACALHTSSKEVSVYVQAAYDGCGGAASAGRADGSRYGL